jgi:hypothetical protein
MRSTVSLNRRPSEGWGPCLVQFAMASGEQIDMDPSLRWDDEVVL